eukprot:914568-Rhodomonas_salina.2
MKRWKQYLKHTMCATDLGHRGTRSGCTTRAYSRHLLPAVTTYGVWHRPFFAVRSICCVPEVLLQSRVVTVSEQSRHCIRAELSLYQSTVVTISEQSWHYIRAESSLYQSRVVKASSATMPCSHSCHPLTLSLSLSLFFSDSRGFPSFSSTPSGSNSPTSLTPHPRFDPATAPSAAIGVCIAASHGASVIPFTAAAPRVLVALRAPSTGGVADGGSRQRCH